MRLRARGGTQLIPVHDYYAAPVSRFVPLVLTAALAGLSVPATVSAGPVVVNEEPVRLGPLPGRTRNPLYVLHLQPSPGRARVLGPGVFEFSAQTDWSNVWEKWSRSTVHGLQMQDVDMEMVRTGLTARLGLPYGVEVAVEVPLITLMGGVTDPTIQAWHRLIKVDNGGRERVRDNRFNYELRMGNRVNYRVDRPLVMGLGDITTQMHVQFLRPRGSIPGISGRFYAKLPTGRLARGTGSGEPDLAAVVHFEHGFRRFAVYGSAGVIVFGRAGDLGTVLRPASFTWSSVLEVGLTPGWSLIAQLHGNTAFHKGFVHRFMSYSPVGFEFGTKVRLGPMDIGFGMEQDIVNGDPSADVTLVFDASWRVDELPRQRVRSELSREALGRERL